MRRRQYMALGAALLAGCTGGGSDSTPTDPSTPTDSPTPTETPSPTASPTPSPTPELSLGDVSLPDGVTEDEVTTDLVTGHQQLILGEPYTLDLQRTVEGFETAIRKTTIEIGTNRVHQAQSASGASTKSFWKEPSAGYARANGGEFYYTIPAQIDRARVAELPYVRNHVAAGDYAPVDAVRREGGPVIQASASSTTPSDHPEFFAIADKPPVGTIDEYAGGLTFEPEGLIRVFSLDWSYTDDSQGDSYREQLEYNVSGVGETEVTPPGWLETAKQQAVTFDAALSDDGKYVVVEIEGEASLPDNWAISMSSENAGHGFTNESVTADGGDTVYIGISDGEAVVGVNEKPSGVEDLGGRVFFLLDINGVEVIERSI